jgi:hypothetical protein
VQLVHLAVAARTCAGVDVDLVLALLVVLAALAAFVVFLALFTLWMGALLDWLLPLAGESPAAAVVRPWGRRLRRLLPPEACRCPWKRDDAPMHLAWCPRAGVARTETRR